MPRDLADAVLAREPYGPRPRSGRRSTERDDTVSIGRPIANTQVHI
jgi:hypothetical protein